MNRIIIIVLLMPIGCPAQDQDLPKTFSQAQDYMMLVAKQMPKWDADPIGQFERPEIALVKQDILNCQADTDPDDFMDDIEQLRQDADALVALDEALQTEHVI